MAFVIQLVSSHPVLTSAVETLFGSLRYLRVSVLPSALTDAEATSQCKSPRLFLLDGCSLRTDLGPLAARCRTHAPGSKFLALLPPGSVSLAEKLRLFNWGIDGLVELGKSWQTELPRAIPSVLKGQPWVSPEVMLGFVNQVKSLLNAQLQYGHFLTAREGQVLQFLVRRLTNKEISCTLGISERTVKYHVSNILGKLRLEDRRGLSLNRVASIGPQMS